MTSNLVTQSCISAARAGRQRVWAEEGDWSAAEGAGVRQGGGPEGPGGGQASS